MWSKPRPPASLLCCAQVSAVLQSRIKGNYQQMVQGQGLPVGTQPHLFGPFGQGKILTHLFCYEPDAKAFVIKNAPYCSVLTLHRVVGRVGGKQTCPLLQYCLGAVKSSPHHMEPLRSGSGAGCAALEANFLFLSGVFAVVVGALLGSLRNVVGYIFTNDTWVNSFLLKSIAILEGCYLYPRSC